MTNKEAVEVLKEELLLINPNDLGDADIEKWAKALDLAIKALEERPTGKWVSVKDRLPEKWKEVIVTDIETYNTYVSWYCGNGVWRCDNGAFKDRIVAWMPLAEPYKETENDF